MGINWVIYQETHKLHSFIAYVGLILCIGNMNINTSHRIFANILIGGGGSQDSEILGIVSQPY